jgi:Icc-related predicted phosphoesterase
MEKQNTTLKEPNDITPTNTTLKQYINTTQERPHDIFIINGVILKRDEIYETYTGAEVVHNENTEVLLSNPPKYRYMVELE